MNATAPAAVRAGTSDDAILGVAPKEVFSPATIEEAAAVLGEKARAKASVGFIGGGTALSLGRPPRRLDAVLRTEHLKRIVEHAPSDQIIVVEAGITLAALQRAVAAHGQRLALDPPLPERCTIGGLLATNGFGPRRTRYGSLRDLIIGVTLVRADGVPAKGGGKVVKNVAGFDLPKMMVGSLGTLGLVATATFRLHPLPETDVTLVAPGRTARGVRELVSAMRGAQIEPSAVAALSVEKGLELGIRFEGFAAGVKEQVERTLALAAKNAAACDVPDGAAAAAYWARHDAARTAGPLRAKVAMLPSAFEEFFERVFPTLRAALSEAAFAAYPTLGISFFSGVPSDDVAAAAAISSARSSLAA
ncbi:MAG TPA: FAD-binding oxidoreductase, partial [Thermoanaerobaculia bacterium]|nr:FAD-binding oxidoreductase [Thermoanaerobaculia bacterium]